MALISCKECAKEVSDQAEVCPHCGFRLRSATTVKVKPENSSTATGCLWLIALIILFVVISHCTEDDKPTSDTVSFTPPAPSTPNTGNHWKELHSQGVMHFVLIDKAALLDEDVYRDAVAKICSIKDICHVLFWTDRAMVPQYLPMNDAQLATEVAMWSMNSNSGLREWSWNCKVVGKKDSCL